MHELVQSVQTEVVKTDKHKDTTRGSLLKCNSSSKRREAHNT